MMAKLESIGLGIFQDGPRYLSDQAGFHPPGSNPFLFMVSYLGGQISSGHFLRGFCMSYRNLAALVAVGCFSIFAVLPAAAQDKDKPAPKQGGGLGFDFGGAKDKPKEGAPKEGGAKEGLGFDFGAKEDPKDLPKFPAPGEEPGKNPAPKGGPGFAQGGKLAGDLSDLLDMDGDGNVSDVEAQKAAADFGKEANAKNRSEKGKRILDALDKDGDGKVAPNEAQVGVAQARAQNGAGAEAAAMFERFDADKSGGITGEEFAAGLGPLAQLLGGQAGQLFGRLDGNRDGQISFVESQFAAEAMSNQFRGPQQGGGERKPQINPQILAAAQQVMARLDRNKDTNISKEEAAKDKQAASEFPLVDANVDESLSLEEVYNFIRSKNPQLEPKEEPRRFPFGFGRGPGRGR